MDPKDENETRNARWPWVAAALVAIGLVVGAWYWPRRPRWGARLVLT